MPKRRARKDAPPKKPRGRPAKLTMPDPIPVTLENIARSVLESSPKKKDEWDFMKRLDEGKSGE